MKIGSQVSANLKHALLLENSKKTNKQQKQKEIVGILSFEAANVMSKTVHLHKSLTDKEISKLKNEIFKSEGVKALVSDNESQLLELALSEKLDDLNRVAAAVSRLGKKCTLQPLRGFEHVYGDIVNGVIDVKELGFLVKDMDAMIKKMERYVNTTASLYSEMEVLNELEQATKKFQNNQHEESRKAFEQKLTWQKQDVRHLKDVSIWNQTFDKVVELLVRTLCTIYARIRVVFGDEIIKKDLSNLSALSNGSFARKMTPNSEIRALSKNKLTPQRGQNLSLFQQEDFSFACGVGPGRLFMECLSLSSSASKVDDDDVIPDDRASQISGFYSVTSSVRKQPFSTANSLRFSPKSRLTASAPSTTVGGSALALHYANVIIVIEKLLRYPHLVGEEARDDLYQMLPTSLRLSLKISLKSYIKDLAIYDAPLAHDWKEKLDGMLKWLSPLAHNMIRWQSERNFEQQQIVSRTNVLLLQTLYFADRAKTEATVCELLVGLNYICRYEHQQNALLDCASSFDFDDCPEWRLQ